MWPLVRSKYGYAVAFALGAVFNRYVFGTVKRPLAPAWVAWLFPVAVFVVAWLYLLVRTRHDN